MPTYDEAMTALRNAHVKGDEGAARRLASIAQGLKPAANDGTPSPSMTSTSRATPGSNLGAPTQKPEDMAPYVWNQAKKGFASLGEIAPMVADVVSMPLRPYERALGMNVPESMFPATQATAKHAQTALNIDPRMTVPKDQYGKPRLEAEMAGQVANFAGMSAIPSGAVVAGAEKPLAALAKEAAGIGLSGIGAAEGKHLAPKGYEDTGEFLGSLTGPMLAQKLIDAAAGGGNWVSKTGQKTGVVGAEDFIRGGALKMVGMDKQAEEAYARAQAARVAEGTANTAKVLGPQLRAPQVQQNIAEAQGVAAKVPGFGENLTLGRTTNAPGIQSLEKHFGSTEDTIGLARQRAQGLESAIGAQTERRFPAPQEATPISGIQRAAAEKVARLDEGVKRLDDQERALAMKYQRGDQEASGIQAQEVRTKRMAAAKAAGNTRYEAVSQAADAAGVKVDVSDVRDLAKKINADAGNTFQSEPGVIGEILRNYELEGKGKSPAFKGGLQVPSVVERKSPVVPMDEFRSLLRRTNEDLGALSGQVANGVEGAANKRRQLTHVKVLLEKKMTEMEGPQYGEVGKLLKDANSYWRDKYAKIFKEGVGGEMGAMGRFGQTSSNENAKIFSNLVLKPNDPSGMREYLEMTGGDPKGMQALENGVMDIMARKVTQNADGTINRTALNNFLRDNKQSLDLVPAIRKKIENVESAAKNITSNREMINTQRREYTNSTLRKVAGSDNPDATVSMALRSPRVMQTLLNSATTVDEKQAVARAIVDKVSAEKNPMEFMTKNKAALESALGKRQMAYLGTILKAKEIAGRVEAPSFVAFEKLKDPLSGAIGTSIPQAISEQKSITQRFASPAYAISRVGIRWWNKLRNDQRDEILKDAIFDPEFAESLATYFKDGTPVAKTALNPHLIPYFTRAAGQAAGELANPESTPPTGRAP